jgi:hypothetical protein
LIRSWEQGLDLLVSGVLEIVDQGLRGHDGISARRDQILIEKRSLATAK